MKGVVMAVKTNFFRALAVIAVALTAGLLLLALVGTKPARAAFPGQNGKIAFSVDDWGYGSGFIYTMNPDGSNQTQLTSGSGGDSEPAYAPDGSKIVFTSARDGNAEIYVMNSDGSGQTRLTNDPASDSQPAFSSDGSKVAFTSERDGNAEIYVLNADSSGTPTRLTNDGAADVDPAFSPDGSKIAFTSERDGNKEVYAMDADGADPIRLTNDPTDDFQPAYAPDGSKIAFATKRDGLNSEVYVMNQDGSGQTGLTNGSDDYTDFGPTFSPDGSKIAFESYFSCEEGYCAAIIDGGISTMNSDGSGRVILTDSSVEQGPDWGTQTPDTTPPDTTPPDTSITSGLSDPTNDNTPAFSFSGSDDLSASANLLFSYKVDNGGWSSYSTGTSVTLGGFGSLRRLPHLLRQDQRRGGQ